MEIHRPNAVNFANKTGVQVKRSGHADTINQMKALMIFGSTVKRWHPRRLLTKGEPRAVTPIIKMAF
jgi:hypothetical protein